MHEGQLGIAEQLAVSMVDCDVITVSRQALLELIARLERGDQTALKELEDLVK
jgi:hypothetical protein